MQHTVTVSCGKTFHLRVDVTEKGRGTQGPQCHVEGHKTPFNTGLWGAIVLLLAMMDICLQKQYMI